MTLRTCTQCQVSFPVSPQDLAQYQYFEVPTPNLCFDCRLQRRLASYNRRKLYWRTCSHSGKQIVSWLSPDKPFAVYDKSIWYSDAWDALNYGRDFDFSRPFFPQMYELMLQVPMLSMAIYGTTINSDFTNDSAEAKNCYLSYDFGYGEDVLYSETFSHLKSALDCHLIRHSELAYECTACRDCYDLKFARYCLNCSNSWFLRDCVGCKNCFGCANLRQKQYYVFNKPVDRDGYEAFLAQFASGNYEVLQQMQRQIDAFFAAQPVRAQHGLQLEDCVGNWLVASKNSYYCFNSERIEDCRYCTDIVSAARACMDVHVWGNNTECCYNCMIIGTGAHRLLSCMFTGFGVSDAAYCMFCTRNCSDLLGCVGLRQKSCCILNKQYSRPAYLELKKRIEQHMRESGEWGHYFPPQYSYFGYNETLAETSFPLTKEDVLSRGWLWSDYQTTPKAPRTVPAAQLPAAIESVGDEVLDWSILCQESGKPFKIVAKELQFYREHHLPLPRLHPDMRHARRLGIRGPYKLYAHVCAHCAQPILSNSNPAAKEYLLCEGCYEAAI